MATTFLEPGSDATQDLSLWAPTNALSGTGTLASDTTHAQDGTRAIKCATTVAGDLAANITANGVAADAGTCMSAWYYFSSTTPANVTQFMSAEATGAGSMIIGLALTTTGTIRIGGRGATQLDGTTVLSANTYYRISLSFLITSVSNYTAKVYINGVLELTMTNATGNLGLTGASVGSFGINNSSQNGMSTPGPITMWVDSVYVDNRANQTDCGNIHVTAKRPFSNGTVTNFTTKIGSGGSGYGTGHASQVNEQPLSLTNGWSMVGAGSAVTEEYTIEGLSVGDVDLTTATLIDYMGWVDVKALIAETASIIVGGASSNISVTTSAAVFTKIAGSAVYPSGGTDIGVTTATTITTFSLYECGIVVAYIPVVAAASSYGSLAMMGAG